MDSQQILEVLWRGAVQGSIGVGIVWLVIRTFPGLTANARNWLWRLAGLKFLVSLFAIVPLALLPAPPGYEANVSPPIDTSFAAPLAHSIVPAIPAPKETPREDLLFLVWAAGALVVWMRIGLHAVAIGRLKRDAVVFDNIRSLPVLTHKVVAVPMLVGLTRPAILLPVLMKDGHREAAIAHELAHHARRDVPWQLAQRLIGGLYWFAPPALWACRQAAHAAEEACDLRTLAAGPIDCQAYAAMLLQYARRGTPSAPAVGLSTSGAHLARRILAMNTRKPPLRLPGFLAALAIAACGIVPLSVVAQTRLSTDLSGSHAVATNSSMDRLVAQIVGRPDVQLELGFSSAQRDAMAAVMDKWDRKIRQLGDELEEMKRKNVSDNQRIAFDGKERPAIFAGWDRAKIEVLTQSQLKRAQEITLQAFGEQCLAFPQIATQVGLNDSQHYEAVSISQNVQFLWVDHLNTAIRAGYPHQNLNRLTAKERRRLDEVRAQKPAASGEERVRLQQEEDRLIQKMFVYGTSSQQTEAFKRSRQLMVTLPITHRLIRKRANAEIRSLLSPAQNRKFEAMKGKSFVPTSNLEQDLPWGA